MTPEQQAAVHQALNTVEQTYGQVFFQKLAQHNIVPASEAQAISMLQTADMLRKAAGVVQEKAAQDSGDFYTKVANELSQSLYGVPLSTVNNLSHEDREITKLAAAIGANPDTRQQFELAMLLNASEQLGVNNAS